MKKNTLVIQPTRPIDEVIENTRLYAKEKNHFFDGDCHTGCFSGKSLIGRIKGHYEVQGQQLLITLEEKPALVPIKKIHQALENYFNQ